MRSHLNALCAFAPYTLYVYYIYLDSQLITLSIDINIMEMILWSILWLCGKLKFFDFYQTFFNMDISLDKQHKLVKFSLCVLYYHIEGTVSQTFDLGLSFCFMKSRKSSFKN